MRFQVGSILQVLSVATVSFSPSVQQDIGVGNARRRTVQIVDRQGPVGRTTPVVIVEPGIDLREIHGLGIDVFRTLDGVFSSDPRAREQQPGERSCSALLVVLVIHECRVRHVNAVVVVLVAADREVGNQAFRQAAAHRPFPPASPGCRCFRFRPRTANQPPAR